MTSMTTYFRPTHSKGLGIEHGLALAEIPNLVFSSPGEWGKNGEGIIFSHGEMGKNGESYFGFKLTKNGIKSTLFEFRAYFLAS